MDSNEVMPTNGDVKLTCCSDCSAKFEDEAGELRRRRTNMVSLSSLPPWLKDETTRLGHNDEVIIFFFFFSSPLSLFFF